MTKFLKESFKNGNRFTNIVLSFCTLLLTIIGIILWDMYGDFKAAKTLIYKHDTKIEVHDSRIGSIETNLNNHLNKNKQ